MLKLWISFILFICEINVIVMEFARVGYYPNMSSFGINHEHCGLRQMPANTVPINFGPNCFGNQYPNWTFADYSLPKRQQHYKSSQTRIVYGLDPELNESPWTVFLSFQWLDLMMLHFCTGTLIAPYWVLTSASWCYESGHKVVVSAGTNRALPWREGRVTTVQKERMFKHPKYHNRDYDLMLFKLDEPFYPMTTVENLLYTLNTICLPEKGLHNQMDETATFYGFGHPVPRNPLDPGQNIDTRITGENSIVLKKFEFTLKPNQTPLIWVVPHNDTDPSTCRGDSGGPLVQDTQRNLRGVLVGMSTGIPRDEKCPRIESYFLSISQHIDWIFDVIRKDSVEEDYDEEEDYE